MENALQAIEVARESGKIRKGVNEVTKSVERANAELVVIADDVSPKELVMHLPILCEEKGVQCVEDACGKEELGAAAGLAVPTVAVAITTVGNAQDLMKEVKAELKTAAAEQAPAPEPETPAEKEAPEEPEEDEDEEKKAAADEEASEESAEADEKEGADEEKAAADDESEESDADDEKKAAADDESEEEESADDEDKD